MTGGPNAGRRASRGWPRTAAELGLGVVLGLVVTVAGERVRWGGSWFAVVTPVAVALVVATAAVLWRRRLWPVAVGAAVGSIVLLAFAATLVAM